MYNLINNQNNQQSNGFAVNEKERGISGVFSALMRKVYTWMTLALLITGVTAYGVASSPTLLMTLMTSRGLLFGLIIAELALVFIITGALQRLSLTTATLLFIVYSVLNGAMLSSVFVVYTMTSIAKVFFITAGTFGAMAFYGYTTKKDLSGFGTFLIMGVVGILVAMLINLFLQSSALSMAISVIGVLLFAGLTAYDTQKIKSMYFYVRGTDFVGKSVVMGALTLYLDFVNMFTFLLNLLGNRE